jgi:hypothetical protein
VCRQRTGLKGRHASGVPGAGLWAEASPCVIMLLSLYLPFSDFRALFADGFSRLRQPSWPIPQLPKGHIRGIGSIRRRRKEGFEGWVGEGYLAFGISAIALCLPRRMDHADFKEIHLIRKACFFDGLLNGRFEFLFSVEPKDRAREAAFSAAKYVLNLPTLVRRHNFNGSLRSVAKSAAHLWADSTIKHGHNAYREFVRAGRPVCIVESEASLHGRNSMREDSPEGYPNIELTILGAPSTELMLIWPSADQQVIEGMRQSTFRFQSRFVRTYSLRLLQNVEGLSLLFGMPVSDIADDRIQNLLNEYTRQINRSRQRIEEYAAPKTIGYCYSAFSRIYPGRIDALRTMLLNSDIRPNVVKKVIELLDISEMSNIHITGDFNMEKVMGDKFEHIDVSGQGVALGRGAQASVSQSTNAPSETLSSALDALAGLVRKQAGRADADVEATLLSTAAKKAESGDEAGAASSSRSWVLDLAKSAGSAVLAAFLKSHLGMG